MYSSNGYKAAPPKGGGAVCFKVMGLSALLLFFVAGLPAKGFSLTPDNLLVQQGIQVRGTVTDINGEPLIGVSVVEMGNPRNVAITDVDGMYNIKVPQDAVLEFSIVGMKKIEVPVNNKSVVDVVMNEDAWISQAPLETQDKEGGHSAKSPGCSYHKKEKGLLSKPRHQMFPDSHL